MPKVTIASYMKADKMQQKNTIMPDSFSWKKQAGKMQKKLTPILINQISLSPVLKMHSKKAMMHTIKQLWM